MKDFAAIADGGLQAEDIAVVSQVPPVHTKTPSLSQRLRLIHFT